MITCSETTISKFFGFDTTGIAEFIRARKAIQYSASIDEWVAIMEERNNGGYANDWLIGDNKTGQIARLELGLKNQILEKTTRKYLRYIFNTFQCISKLPLPPLKIFLTTRDLDSKDLYI